MSELAKHEMAKPAISIAEINLPKIGLTVEDKPHDTTIWCPGLGT